MFRIVMLGLSRVWASWVAHGCLTTDYWFGYGQGSLPQPRGAGSSAAESSGASWLSNTIMKNLQTADGRGRAPISYFGDFARKCRGWRGESATVAFFIVTQGLQLRQGSLWHRCRPNGSEKKISGTRDFRGPPLPGGRTASAGPAAGCSSGNHRRRWHRRSHRSNPPDWPRSAPCK